MILDGADYVVRFVDLPPSIGGVITPNDDGTFSIYINARHSVDRQLAAFKHEVNHIAQNDFYNGKSIQEIEAKRRF